VHLLLSLRSKENLMKRASLVTAVAVCLILAAQAGAEVLASWDFDAGISNYSGGDTVSVAGAGGPATVTADDCVAGPGMTDSNYGGGGAGVFICQPKNYASGAAGAVAGGEYFTFGLEVSEQAFDVSMISIELAGDTETPQDDGDTISYQLEYNAGGTWTALGTQDVICSDSNNPARGTLTADTSGVAGLQNITDLELRLVIWNGGGLADYEQTGMGDFVAEDETSDITIEGLIVPEPATMTLLGLGGLVALRRRRRA
jgi:hypothetical protein